MENKRLIGDVARVVFALLLTFFFAQGAFAAAACACPGCPAHSCSHVGCNAGHDDSKCTDLSDVACAALLSGGSLLPATRIFGLSFAAGAAVVASSGAVDIAGGSVGLRRAAAPRSTAPPAHIVFCRLLR